MNTPCRLSRIALVAAAWYGALIVSSCAINSPPRGALEDARAAIVAAQHAGADRAAPAEMAGAREKLDLGTHYVAAKDYKPARWLFEQAQIDANLATAKSEASAAMYEAARQARQAQAATQAPRGAR